MELSIIILAGGQSKRMGADKALININNIPLLKHIYLEAKKLTEKIYIVTSWPEKYEEILPENCQFIKETNIKGPLIAFQQGLKEISTSWVLLLACDLPNFTIKELKEIYGQIQELNSDYMAFLPRNEKGWDPLCGFYHSSCLPSLESFINQGGNSFQKWLNFNKIGELNLKNRDILFNCNTPKDLENINLEPQPTQDGSFTFFSPEFQEHFHSNFGAKQEAIYKFIIPCKIPEFVRENNTIKIIDICYGLGYNTAAALSKIWEINPQCHVQLIALEINAHVPLQTIKHNLLSEWESPIPEFLTTLAQEKAIENDLISAQIFYGDARVTIKEIIAQNFQADALFLDPFSPPKCPQLWTVDFLNLVTQCLHKKGILATYSCAASVRKALQLTGINIASTPGVGRKAPGTIASYDESILPPLSPQELAHLETKASIPYRDPQLNDSAENLIQRRLEAQKNSNLESSSSWKKRFFGNNFND